MAEHAERPDQGTVVKNCPFLGQILYPYGKVSISRNEPRWYKFFRFLYPSCSLRQSSAAKSRRFVSIGSSDGTRVVGYDRIIDNPVSFIFHRSSSHPDFAFFRFRRIFYSPRSRHQYRLRIDSRREEKENPTDSAG